MRHTEPAFPADAVRDLIGIVRAVYASSKADGAAPLMLEKISRLGVDLAKALDLAATTSPGSIGHAAAWRRAEETTARVAELVDALTPAEPILKAACQRVYVRGAPLSIRKKSPER